MVRYRQCRQYLQGSSLRHGRAPDVRIDLDPLRLAKYGNVPERTDSTAGTYIRLRDVDLNDLTDTDFMF